jgi:PAS domain S-box-containing protein
MDNLITNILYIEDNLADRLYFQHESREAGYPFHSDIAASLREAIDLLKNNTYHAVVSDFFLGDGQALDLMPYLGESPLIIIVGEGSEEAAVNALKAGAYDCLTKDANYNYLKIIPITVIKTIEQKKQRDELHCYRTQLEQLIEKRTNELTEMYLQLRESEASFRNIFDNSNDYYIITDYDFNFIEANSTLLNHFGVTKQFLAGHALIDYLVPAYHGLIYNKLELLKKGIPSGDLEIEIISPATKEILTLEINNKPIVFNHKNVIISAMRNITERKSLSRKLFETIIRTEEEERSRIAKDLHDEIGPLLSALKIYTTSFIENNNIEKKNKLAGQIGVIIRDMIESVKNISNDMSPHVLVNFGLIAAIQNISDIFSRNITIHLQSNIEKIRFSEIVESVIYRVIKELINNTIKHAHASEVHIIVNYSDQKLECIYKDDGIGFDLNQYFNNQTQGMGLNNIRSRIQSLGGHSNMITSPGKGFELTLYLKSITIEHGKQ